MRSVINLQSIRLASTRIALSVLGRDLRLKRDALARQRIDLASYGLHLGRGLWTEGRRRLRLLYRYNKCAVRV